MGDFLGLEGVSCLCRIGVPDEERASPQAILLDVKIEADLSKAGKSDSLFDSIDYHGLETALREIAEGKERRLLEKLAEDLAETALLFDNRIRLVEIAVHKSPAVMPKTRRVSARIIRGRG